MDWDINKLNGVVSSIRFLTPEGRDYVLFICVSPLGSLVGFHGDCSVNAFSLINESNITNIAKSFCMKLVE